MKRSASWAVVALVVLAAAILAIYGWMRMRAPPPAPPAPAIAAPAAAGPAPEAPAPAIAHPIETPAPAQANGAPPLPALEHSDATITDALAGVIGRQTWAALFRPELVIRHIVATVDNLPRSTAPARVMPLQPVPGPFIVDRDGDAIAIGGANPARYARYVTAMQQVSVPALVDVYVRFYPLFQRAYEELGYPNAYFNDRLFVAIDDLLAAPDPDPPVRLAQPKVLYQYADPGLESRSAGQKIMVRIGRDNAAKVKRVLGELRAELLRRAPKQ